MKQLVRENIGVLTPSIDLGGTLISFNNFIATLDNNGNIIQISVSDICLVSIVGTFNFKLKPIKKSVGECSCTEDPITNVAQSKIGEMNSIVIWVRLLDLITCY
ncbi:hypothetical protein [Chengkuizengella sediminis]|uniref:hypothetical protein n=1 Tax=Chengkuizengella sediminis TaxID=1885917 RepID=UPI00138A4A4E|nr:hypothetical protein [Chengkuizengella sediminis]NDI34648.1 hypothetical protein [Chengkuizengella sediminis]